MMEMDCDALYESQIITLIASFLSTINVSCPFCQQHRKEVFGKRSEFFVFFLRGKTLYCHVVVQSILNNC